MPTSLTSTTKNPTNKLYLFSSSNHLYIATQESNCYVHLRGWIPYLLCLLHCFKTSLAVLTALWHRTPKQKHFSPEFEEKASIQLVRDTALTEYLIFLISKGFIFSKTFLDNKKTRSFARSKPLNAPRHYDWTSEITTISRALPCFDVFSKSPREFRQCELNFRSAHSTIW